jgi:hypothetical protein
MRNPDEAPRAEEQEELLPWHKPMVQRLAVTLDTRFGGGSWADCTTNTTVTNVSCPV